MQILDPARLARQMADRTHELDARAALTVPLAVTGSALLFLGAGMTDFWLGQLAATARPARVLSLLLDGSAEGSDALRALTDSLQGPGNDPAVAAIAQVLADHGSDALAHSDLHGVGDLLGSLYSELRSRSGQAAHGAFYTPQSVAALMAAFNDPPPGSTIHDPCCGSGVLLRAQARAIRDAGGDVDTYRFSGNDIDPIAAALCFINLMAAGVSHPTITVGNALAPEPSP